MSLKPFFVCLIFHCTYNYIFSGVSGIGFEYTLTRFFFVCLQDLGDEVLGCDGVDGWQEEKMDGIYLIAHWLYNFVLLCVVGGLWCGIEIDLEKIGEEKED